MSPELEALRKNKSAFTAVVAAALGFALFSLAGAAILMGWIGPGIRRADVVPPPAATAARPQANDMGLSPGETVVIPADAPATPPVKAEAPAPAPAPAAKAPAPAAAKSYAPKPAPSTPRYAEPKRMSKPRHATAPSHPTEPGDRWPQPGCGNCGVVHAIRVFPDLWEVHVRFDDGGRRTLRYPRPQHWHVGDRIRYEGGQLVPE